MISKDPADILAMKQAERNGKLVMLSDWDHLTGKEYMKALEETGYDILCVSRSCILDILTISAAPIAF